MKTCCKEWQEATGEILSISPMAMMYPVRPPAQIEKTDDGKWAINGCCGGGCFVITDVKFCPFCGADVTY